MSDRRAPVQDVEGEITYHQQMSRCGKPGCLRCREGRGHGPYWYAYQNVNGYTRRSYVGKELPANLRGESQPQVAVQVEEPAPVAVRLWLLGQLRLERRERDAASWEVVRDPSLRHQRVYALLAALLCTQERILLRDQIIEMLWPDLDLERGSARLDRAVYNLRQLLSPGRLREADSSLLVVERDMVVLADQSRLWVDADAFEEQLHRAHASTDPGVKERLLEEANILYHGKFFPGKLLSDEMKARRDALHRSWVSAQLELAD